MLMLFFVAPTHYFSAVIYLLIGCLVLGSGIYLEVLADVAMLPGESLVRAISITWATDFGLTKIACDVSMTVTAGLLSLLFAHRLDGIRESTLIASFLVGYTARRLGRLLHFLPAMLFPESGKKD